MIEKWEKQKEELVYDGYRKIIRKTFQMPNGEESAFDVLTDGNAVCVLALTPDQKVILSREYRQGPEKILNELPGGGCGKKGNPLEAIKNELLEETGYTGEFKMIGKSFDMAYSDLIRYHFVATHCQKVQAPKNIEPEELTEPILLSLDEFKELIKSGELTDSETAYRGLEYLKLL